MMAKSNRVSLYLAAAVAAASMAAAQNASRASSVSRWEAAGELLSSRAGACAAALPEGRVLVTGGQNEAGILSSAEILGPGGVVQPAPAMSFARAGHVCVALKDGSVLVAGGRAPGDSATPSAERFDPAAGEWEAVGWLSAPRAGATAAVLRDGRVVVVGGEYHGALLPSIEIYDPEQKAFTVAGGTLRQPRIEHAAATLRDGRVVIAGGTDGKAALDTIEIFDPRTGEVSAAGTLSSPRAGLTATPLLDGRVFFAGGSNGAEDLASTEVLDPSTGRVAAAAPMDLPRRGHAALRVPDNNSVLIFGGTWKGEPLAASGLYIPWRDAYEPMARLATAVTAAAGTALSGKVVMAGGAARSATSGELYSAELPTIRTDKEDYAPGEWVNINGANWTPGNKVNLVVRDLASNSIRWEAAADAAPVASGEGSVNLAAAFQMTVADLGKTFSLTATEQVTNRTAQVWLFTDGNVGARVQGGPTSITITSYNYGNNDLSCSGSNPIPGTKSVGTTHTNIAGINDKQSLKLVAPSVAGYVFLGWTKYSGNANFFPVGGDSATICITIPNSNDQANFDANYALANTPPVANNDSYSTNEDTPLSVTAPGVLSNDTDADSNALTAVLVSGPSNGTTTLNPNGSFTYTPNANFSGTDSFTYKAFDGTANSNTATVTITVNPVNDAPTLDAIGNQTVLEDAGSQTVNLTGISPGPANESSQAVTVTATSSDPSIVPDPSVTGSGATRTLTYTPAANAYGTVTITVAAKDNGGTDNGGQDTTTRTFTITVTPVNDAPGFTRGADQTVNEDAGTQSVAWATNISPGPNEAGQGLMFVVSNDNNALFSVQPAISATGELTYTPAPDAFGEAKVTVYLKDDGGTANGGVDTSPSVTFTITVNPVNDAPTLGAIGNQTVLEDAGSQTVNLTGISPGPVNESSQAVTVTATSSDPSIVPDPSVTGSGATRTLTYTPAANANGTVTITVTAKDNGGTDNGGQDTTTRTFTITVTPVNDKPVAQDGSLSTPEDTNVSIDLKTLISDVETAPAYMTYAILNGPSSGTLTANGPAGVYTFAPALNFNGQVTFTYKVTDRGDPDDCTLNGISCSAPLESDVRTVTINVTPVNDAPVLTGAVAPDKIDENGTVTVSGSVSDPDTGDTHTLTILWGDGTSSSAVLAPNGSPKNFSITHQYLDDDPTGTSADTYSITITVGDNGKSGDPLRDDPKGDSKTASVEVRNVAPEITSVTGPSGPLPVSQGQTTVTASFTDPGTRDTFTCTFSWDDQTPDTTVTAGVGAASCSGSHLYAAAGVYTVTVKVTDDDGGSAEGVFQYVVVYDPSAGFVTGGGWIISPKGAYAPDTELTGKATFGFVSKYRKGANVPEGNTEFQFHAASMNFKSTAYEWLVIAGAKAQYKGVGTINGMGNYGFLLTATDGQMPGGGGIDKFRIKIWQIGGGVIYDNSPSLTDDIDNVNPQAISGGSIVIHTGK
ncbi:MAG: tandem-95 repeat protein [Acidobacteriota bacterium]